MPTASMSLDDFALNLDVHGADLQRWPAAAAGDAAALLAVSPDARELRRQAEELAARLESALFVQPVTTTALRSRILDQVADSPRPPLLQRWLFDARHWLRPALLALIPLCLGFAVGIGYPRPTDVNDDLISAVSLFAFAAYQDDLDAR